MNHSAPPSDDAMDLGSALEAASSSGDAGGKRDPLKRQQALVAVGRRAIAMPDLSILMQDAADLLAEMLDVEYSGVAERSADGMSIRHRVWLGKSDAGEPRQVVHQSSATGIDSLAGYVVQVAHPVIVADLARETHFEDPFLRKHGIRSALAVPLSLHERSFGVLAAYSSRQQHFADEDLLFAETIAHLISTAIARKHAEDSLANERRLALEVLQTVDALVLVLNVRGQIVRINRAGERLSGFSAAEVVARPIWSVFPVPEEVQLFHRIFEKLQQGKSPIEYESFLLTKHSQRRRIAWSYGAVLGSDGTMESVIATGIDITKQRLAEEKAEQAEQAAEARRATTEQAPAPTQRAAEAPPGTADAASPAADGAPIGSPNLGATPRTGERRRRTRRPYPYHQWIAPIINGQLPSHDQFLNVQCHDIASGGFSFLLPTPPVSDSFVVALGHPPHLTYLTAQVAHVTRVEQSGQRVYLIGCNYMDRACKLPE